MVGDTTILANRSLYVDFTLPYTESGVSMVVPTIDKRKKKCMGFLEATYLGPLGDKLLFLRIHWLCHLGS